MAITKKEQNFKEFRNVCKKQEKYLLEEENYYDDKNRNDTDKNENYVMTRKKVRYRKISSLTVTSKSCLVEQT